jgi:branched-chain amino acid transport system permease protein
MNSARVSVVSADSAARPVLSAGRYAGVIVLAVLALVPLWLGNYGRSLVTEVLLFCIFAMSLNLLVGYTGLVSFGHAAFFGVGAYTVAVLGTLFGVPPVLGGLAAVCVAAVFAAAIGFLCIRVSGVYFIMLTLAFSQLLYTLAIRWRSATGGSDGMAAPRLGTGEETYCAVLLMLTIVYFGLRRLIASPLGQVLVGIRENEARMRAAGYATARYKLLSFMIAGSLGAIAGALFAMHNGFVSPAVVYWMLSGEGLVMVVLGGMGTLVGPMVGAAVLLLLKHFVSLYSAHWELLVGMTFIACVLFFKQGICGWLDQHWMRGSRP